MPDLEILDAHAHVFPNEDRGLQYQADAIRAGRQPKYTGEIGQLARVMADLGVSHTVMLMYMPTRYMHEARMKRQEVPNDPAERERMESASKQMMVQRMLEYNEWGITAINEYPQFSTFAGLDPVYMDEETLRGEIRDKVSRGARGVKIVLRALAIYPDDRRLWPVYEEISRLGVPITAQVGKQGEAGDRGPYANPALFARALEEFPDLRVQAVHLGGGYEDEIVELCRRFPGFYTDLSSRLAEINNPESELNAEWFADYIRTCGAEHVMYGTNFPGGDPAEYATLMRNLPLNDHELELVANGNAKRFLRL